MAAPVVTGAIALMLEANAALTPNAVKAILEYTAEARDGYNHLTQGAGFLNARGAVELARAFVGHRPRPRALERSGALEPAHHLGQSPRRGRHARRPRQRVEARRDVGRRADARRRRRSPGASPAATAKTDCEPSPWTAPCSVVTPDCDPAARSTGSDVPVTSASWIFRSSKMIVGADPVEVVSAIGDGTTVRPRDVLASRERFAGAEGARA